jgi:hypothetical protein
VSSDIEYWMAIFDSTTNPEEKEEARDMLDYLVCEAPPRNLSGKPRVGGGHRLDPSTRKSGI